MSRKRKLERYFVENDIHIGDNNNDVDKRSRKNAYRIYIDGGCKNNNKRASERYAGYGIYVDKLSDPRPATLDSIDDDEVDAHISTTGKTKTPDNNVGKKTTDEKEDSSTCSILSFVSETCACKEPTNNRAELMAAIRCLELLVDGRFDATKDSHITIVNDSKLVYLTVTDYLPRLWRANGFRTRHGNPVANGDLVRRLDAALIDAEKRGWKNLRWQHMNSHQKQPKDTTSNEWCDWYGNDKADQLSNAACRKLMRIKKIRP